MMNDSTNPNSSEPMETGPDAAPDSSGPISAVDLDKTAINESSLGNDPARQNIDVDSVDADIAEAYARDVGVPTDTSTAFLPTDAEKREE